MRLSRLLSPFLASIACLAFFACEDRSTGTSDEHETSMARLYRTDGTPAARAKVKFYSVSDTAQVPAALTYTTENGEIQLPELPAGLYNAVASDGSGTAALIDSIVYSANGKASVLSDTLKPMGILRGRVVVQPQHSPQIAWIQVMGMGLAVNVDPSGSFSIPMPSGGATIYALTREHDYTPTFRTVQIRSIDTVDLGMIELIYTGIPIVKGTSVAYDSINGVAMVRWDRSSSPRVAWYRLDRMESNGMADSRTFPASGATEWFDTLFRPTEVRLNARTPSYSVVALDSGLHPGLDWNHVPLVAPSPYVASRPGLGLQKLGRLPEGCARLDTLAGGLVCLNGPRFDFYTYPTDSIRVWTSPDGVEWSAPFTVPGRPMRAIPWQGNLWVVRGIPATNSSRGVFGEGGVELPELTAAVIEVWDLKGHRLSSDTLPNPEGILGHRLMAHGDTLYLSLDNVRSGTMGATGPAGILPVADSVRAMVLPGNSWRTIADFEYWAEYSKSDEMMMLPMWIASDIGWNMFQLAPSESLGGFEFSSRGGILFASSPDWRFPWQVSHTSQFIYRGDGAKVPAVLAWQGCGIFPSGSDLIGICPRP